MPNPYTLREALDAVGRKLFPTKWKGKDATDKDADAREPPPGLAILGWARIGDDGQPDTTPETGRQISEAREAWNKAVAPRLLSPEEQSAWQRRKRAVRILGDFIRHGCVKAWLIYPDGKRHDFMPSEWEAPDGPWWLNYSASFGGYKTGESGIEDLGGKVWIDREGLDSCVQEIAPVPVPRDEQKQITNAKHLKWISSAKEIVEGPRCPMYRRKPNQREIARRVRKRGKYVDDADTIRTLLKRNKDRWLPTA